MRTFTASIVLFIAMIFAPVSRAQTTQPEALPVLAGRPDAKGAEVLGGEFESRGAGIKFQTPANAKQVKKLGGDDIAQFVIEEKNWRLTASRTTLSQPMPLTSDDPAKRGLMELSAEQLKQNNPGAELLRQDTIEVGNAQVGMIAARVTIGTSRVLNQQAIFAANDQLYYTLTLISPAAQRNADGKSPDNDPAEQRAVEAFRAVVDSVKLLDRAMVKEDQDQRLIRTRALFAGYLTEKYMQSVLVPEQWLRLIKDGKDVGFTHVIENSKKPDGTPGIYVGIRSYTVPEPGVEANAVSWLFVTLDRKHETWNSILQLDDPKNKKNIISEVGSSDWRLQRTLEEDALAVPGEIGPAGKEDKKQPAVKQEEVGVINVTSKARDINHPPFKAFLQKFYIQQAVGHLLPRLLPRNEPKTYMFSTYVSDRRELMARYVDVGFEQDVEIGGKRVRAVPISDRVGFDGDPTMHYVSPDGRFLGSINKAAGISIVPSNAAEVKQIWPKAETEAPVPQQAAK